MKGTGLLREDKALNTLCIKGFKSLRRKSSKPLPHEHFKYSSNFSEPLPWHLDKMVIKIKGKKYFLWRAVDKDGQVIDILMESRRDEKAANKFFRKLLKPQDKAPRVIITDKLKSYGAA